MPKLRIVTIDWDVYYVDDDGNISGGPNKVTASGQWKFLGIEHVRRNDFRSREKLIEMLEIGPIPSTWFLFWQIRDNDHGTVRVCGSPEGRGISSIQLVKE